MVLRNLFKGKQLRALLGVVSVLLLLTVRAQADVRFEGTIYPLRWGQQDGPGDNLNEPYPVLPSPFCIQKGSALTARLMYNSGVTAWKVSYAQLRSKVTGEVYWTIVDPGVSNLKPPSEPYPLQPVPNFIEHAELELTHVMELENPPGGYYITPPYISEVFVVLDAPVDPMNRAWISMLRYSCRWGHRTSTFDDAAQAITFGVFFQRNPGGGFYYPGDTGTRWVDFEEYDVNPTIPPTFKLKAVLDRWQANLLLRGNCRDVSCLTMIALCSVGMDFSTRELTGTLFAKSPTPPSPKCTSEKCPYGYDPDLGSNVYLPHFHTNLICPIGSDPIPEPPADPDSTYDWWPWSWHQICVRTGAVGPPSNEPGIWDPTGAQREDLNGNGYRNPPAHHPSHLWPQKDYWQKPHTQEPGKWLGLVEQPTQGASDPKLGGSPRNLGTWKCKVDTGDWNPPGEPLP